MKTTTQKAVWLVIGECGEYSDFRSWNVAAHTTEEAANAHAKAAEQAVPVDYRSWSYSKQEKFKHPLDPQFNTDYTGTEYRVEMVEVHEAFNPPPTP